MITDPIANYLTQIKNAYMARKKIVKVQHSTIKESISHILRKEGYLNKVSIKSENGKKLIVINLAYDGKNPKLSEIIRVSKPSKRVYAKLGEIPTVLGGMGIVILSTSKGLMEGKEARKNGLGGEVICKLW